MIAINKAEQPPEEPPQEEIDEWCRNIARIIRDGGVWGIPRSGLVFKFQHKNKTMVLVSGNPLHPDFDATQKAFGRIGWRVMARETEE